MPHAESVQLSSAHPHRPAEILHRNRLGVVSVDKGENTSPSILLRTILCVTLSRAILILRRGRACRSTEIILLGEQVTPALLSKEESKHRKKRLGELNRRRLSLFLRQNRPELPKGAVEGSAAARGHRQYSRYRRPPEPAAQDSLGGPLKADPAVLPGIGAIGLVPVLLPRKHHERLSFSEFSAQRRSVKLSCTRQDVVDQVIRSNSAIPVQRFALFLPKVEGVDRQLCALGTVALYEGDRRDKPHGLAPGCSGRR